MLNVYRITDKDHWDSTVNQLGGHPLQLWGWGEVKEMGEWTAHRVLVGDQGNPVGAAQVLQRRLPFPFSRLCYLPRGPVTGSDTDPGAVVSAVAAWAKATIGGIGLTLEPDWPAGADVTVPGMVHSANTVLYPSTLIIDLTQSTDELFADLRKKTRNYVRRALAGPMTFREVESLSEFRTCQAIMRATAQRAGFAIHGDDYYEAIYTVMGKQAPTFVAVKDGEPIAFSTVAVSDRTAFLLYSGVTSEGQALNANRGLMWELMVAMKERGVERFDLNGLLGEGITSFKTSFASHTDELIGTLDIPFSPLFSVWSRALPAARRAMRRAKTGRSEPVAAS